MMFVAIFGNMPLFFCLRLSWSSSSIPAELSTDSAAVSVDVGEPMRSNKIKNKLFELNKGQLVLIGKL